MICLNRLSSCAFPNFSNLFVFNNTGFFMGMFGNVGRSEKTYITYIYD